MSLKQSVSKRGAELTILVGVQLNQERRELHKYELHGFYSWRCNLMSMIGALVLWCVEWVGGSFVVGFEL